MTLRLFNTLSHKKEEFVPARPGTVGMYLCGPTVYGDAHLGNAKTAVAFDVVRRWLEHRGLQVRFVSNVTDVGHITDEVDDEGRDRIAERAALERVEPMVVADRFFWKYFDEMGRLGVRRPDISPRASGHVPEQIALVQELIERGRAYEIDGSVYFAVAAFERYGALSGRSIDELLVGTRPLASRAKRDPRDFALWKRAEPAHVQRWSSPWGQGFPGWHLECSAMALKYLGEGFDIHAGGMDLKFPHHEAEVAQAEGAGRRFARVWMHGNLLTVEGKKMSRSLGNFTTLGDFFEEHDPAVLRYLLVQTHYRSVAEISKETIQAAETGLARLRQTVREVGRRLPEAPSGDDPELEARIETARTDFERAMDDDFNTPEALAALFGLSRHLNGALVGSVPREALSKAAQLFATLGEDVLGLTWGEAESSSTIGELVALLIDAREGFRAARDFARADALRERLRTAGIEVEDQSGGARWRYI